MTHDPIADFITTLRNAAAAGRTEVSVPYSTFKHAIADTLKTHGYITNVEKHGKKVKKTLAVTLAIDASGAARIHGVRRLSKPSRRMYRPADGIQAVRETGGMIVLSTPLGVLSGDDARKSHVGGEVLFRIW